jgi:hypothetical protein
MTVFVKRKGSAKRFLFFLLAVLLNKIVYLYF